MEPRATLAWGFCFPVAMDTVTGNLDGSSILAAHRGKALLKDAYAMEEVLIPNLENHAKDAAEYPQVQNRIQRHLEKARQHAQLVRSCIERLGEKPSATRVTLGKIMGSVGGLGTGAARTSW